VCIHSSESYPVFMQRYLPPLPSQQALESQNEPPQRDGAAGNRHGSRGGMEGGRGAGFGSRRSDSLVVRSEGEEGRE